MCVQTAETKLLAEEPYGREGLRLSPKISFGPKMSVGRTDAWSVNSVKERFAAESSS